MAGRLAYRQFQPCLQPLLHLNGKPIAAHISPVHVICLHGLLGSKQGFYAVCSSLAGLGRTHCGIMSGTSGGMDPVMRHPPRVYHNAAFDWRNHGESFHDANVTMCALADELSSFLEVYATTWTKDSPKRASLGEPMPVFLVAHSMGALVLLHWIWKEHIRRWSRHVCSGERGSLPRISAFSNHLYRIVGAVSVDTAPTFRPDSFSDTLRMIRFLPEIPLDRLRTVRDVEQWILQSGPQDIFSHQQLWKIRYFLSNLDASDPKSLKWRVGLSEIVNALDQIVWEGGGTDCRREMDRGLTARNAQRRIAGQPLLSRPPVFCDFPVHFVFGQDSPYNSSAAQEAALLHMGSQPIHEVPNSSHFPFHQQKDAFMAILRHLLMQTEVEARLM